MSRHGLWWFGAAVAISGCGLVGPSTESLFRGETLDRIGRAIGGVSVEVLDGPGAGTVRRSDAVGRFEMTSADFVSGTAATLRFSGAGIQPRTATGTWQSASKTSSGAYAPFWLDTIEPPIGLEPGMYTLSVGFDPAAATQGGQDACSAFPEELAARSYQTSISASPSPNLYKYDGLVNTEEATLHGIDPWAVGLLSRILFAFAVVGPFVGSTWKNREFSKNFPGFDIWTFTASARRPNRRLSLERRFGADECVLQLL